MKEKIFIFMLMPSKDEFDIIYEVYIKKPLISAGYSIKRDKEIPGSSKIFEDILHNIRTAEIIIADLTGHNVNVFYELGIADEKKRYVIQIAQKGEELPFDLSQRRTIFYDIDERGLKNLSQEILKYVKTYKKEGLIDEIISEFRESESYSKSISFWKSLIDYEPDLNNRQINALAEGTAQNNEIYESYVLYPLLKSFFTRHKEVLSLDIISKLKEKGFLK